MKLRRTRLPVLAVATMLVFAAGTGKAQDQSGGGPSKVEIPADGKKVYEQICQACHMADAKGGGGAGAIPALANNPRLADPQYPITMLLKGRGGMPWFSDMLTPAQMAAVITYVRSHFNNYTDPVTEADVRKLATKTPKAEGCECTE